MKHLAAYCLLVLSGKQNPTADDVTKLLKDVGVSADKESLDQMMRALQGKKLHDLVNTGSKKLVSVAAAPVGGAVAASAGVGAPAAEAKEAKKEEKKEEEADVDMGGLFGDDY